MKTVFRFCTVLLGAALIAGCSMTQGEFNNLQTVVGGSPIAKQEVISSCIANQKTKPLSEKKEQASVFNIRMSSFDTTYCRRLWGAMASGKITYADYVKLSDSTADQSKFIRIMQGR